MVRGWQSNLKGSGSTEAAMRACHNMNPVIDGRKANGNLACLWCSKTSSSYFS
ncbi:unnamed protein product [Arabidopsis halleri]